jgi:hypothetical protein
MRENLVGGQDSGATTCGRSTKIAALPDALKLSASECPGRTAFADDGSMILLNSPTAGIVRAPVAKGEVRCGALPHPTPERAPDQTPCGPLFDRRGRSPCRPLSAGVTEGHFWTGLDTRVARG